MCSLKRTDERISRLRRAFVRHYPTLWRRMLRSWAKSARSSDCRIYLMYAANYLFVTGRVRWAVDPMLPGHLLPELAGAVSARALRRLSFVVLTHDHSDHADYRLLSALRDGGVRFIVPEAMREQMTDRVRPHKDQMLLARPGETLSIDGIELTPFEGLHWRTHPDGRHAGVDATGYLAEVGGRRWLLPGDVRDYRAEEICRFAPVKTLFAHLWLGRGCALQEEPPEVEAFCDFMRATQPERVVLTHLREFSRPPRDMWHPHHARLVRRHWEALGEVAPLHLPRLGRPLDLS